MSTGKGWQQNACSGNKLQRGSDGAAAKKDCPQNKKLQKAAKHSHACACRGEMESLQQLCVCVQRRTAQQG